MARVLRAGALTLACCLIMTSSAARAADPTPRLLLLEPTPAAGPSGERLQAIVARMRAELALLGVQVETAPARSEDPYQELARLAEQHTGSAAASLALQTDQLSLLFVAADTNKVATHVLGGSLASDTRAGAVHAVEVMRPTLLGLSAAGTKDEIAAQPRHAPGAAGGSAGSAPSSPDFELPPGLRARPRPPPPQRLFGEFGAGILADVQFMPPQPVLSLLAGARATSVLRVELLAIIPMHAMARERADIRAYVRASLLGAHLRVALLERPRGDLALAFGPALAIVATARDREPSVASGWTRHTAFSMYARLLGAYRLSRALALHADLSLGTLIDLVRVSSSRSSPAAVSAPSPAWGRLWLAAGLGLGVALL